MNLLQFAPNRAPVAGNSDAAGHHHTAAPRVARPAGALVALLGAAVLAGWALDVDTLKIVLPGLASMKANVALCFVLAGVALFLRSFPHPAADRVAAAMALAVLGLTLLTLLEYGTGLNLGIDQLLFRDPDTPRTLNPGRMAPVSTMGFLLAGIALVVTRLPGRRAFGRILSIGVILLGSAGLLVYLLSLHIFVAALPFQSAAVHTAIGFVILGIGLLAVSRPRTPPGDDRRIAALAAWLLTGAAGAAGLTSFAIIGGQVHQTLAQGLSFALESRIKAITINVGLRTTRAEIITSRPDLLRELRALASNPEASQPRTVVQEVIESFLPYGFSAIAVSLPGGTEIARAGQFLNTTAAEFPLKGGVDRSLLWRDGAYLGNRLPLGDAAGALGTLRVEQALPGLTETLQVVDPPWPSAEFQLCKAIGRDFRCFPTRLTPHVFTQHPAPAGAPARLIYRARNQGAGFAAAMDYRMVSELGAFNRVGDLGLVAARKVDAAEIYAPTARRFALAAGLVACLALLGALLVRVRVRPLATMLDTRVRERTADLHRAIEELRRAMAASHESETRFRALVTATAQIVWTTDANGLIVEDSPSWRAFTGQTYAQWKGVGAFDALHPDDRARIEDVWRESVAHGNRFYAEFRLRHSSDAWRWVAACAVPLRDARGAITGWIGGNTDITERKAAEKKLRDAHEQLERRVAERTAQLAESNEFMRALLDNIQDGIVACNALGVLTLFNAATRKFHGLPQEDIPADQWAAHYDLYQADGRTPMNLRQIPLYRALKGEHVRNVEMIIAPRQGKSRTLLASGRAFRSADGRVLGAVLSMHDVTERKQAELQLRTLAAELARSNRELDDFAHVASHDLQEPLRKVQAFGDLLVTGHGAGLDEQGRDYLARMQGAAKRMSTLITDLLAFSRVSARAQPFSKVDLNQVAREVISDLEVRITSSGARVALDTLPVIDADRLQMRQLLQNLIGNALKYRHPNIAPVVRVYSEAASANAEIRLCVTDNGIGFDMKYLERIFVVFQRLHGRLEYEGTGVGLAICKKIVERHGGRITAESAPGAGATFIASLPVLRQQMAKAQLENDADAREIH